jgi:hypothetical protein
MKIIKGTEIDELEDLNYNLDKLRFELYDKYSFWNTYGKASKDKGIIFKTILFIGLLPKFIKYQLDANKVELVIKEGESELIAHYELPETKIKRFRLQCKYERTLYEDEMKEIDEELDEQRNNYKLTSIGEQTRDEIDSLIKAFEKKRKKKQNKYEFYKECEENLAAIEEQIKVKKSLELSKQKLEQIKEGKSENKRQKVIEKEFELYKYYGNLLDDLSTNLKRIELDKEEQIEELELKEMLSQIKIRN